MSTSEESLDNDAMSTAGLRGGMRDRRGESKELKAGDTRMDALTDITTTTSLD